MGRQGQGHLTGEWLWNSPGQRPYQLALSCPHLQEVLKRLQGKLEQEARVLVSSGQTEVLEQLKGEGLGWGPPVHTRVPPIYPQSSWEEEGQEGTLIWLSPSMPIQPCRWTSPACTT